MSTVHARFFLLAIIPLGVLLAGEAMLGAWSSKMQGLTTPPRELAIQQEWSAVTNCYLNEAASRLYVLSTAFAVLGLSASAGAFFFWQLANSFFSRVDIKAIVIAFGIYCIIGFIAVFNSALGFKANALPSALQIYGLDWISETARRMPGGQDNLDVFNRLLAIVNFSLVIAVSAVVAGTVSCLFYKHSVSRWKQQLSCAQSWLYVAAAVLIAELLFHRSWGGWLGACLDSKVMTNGYGKLVTAFTANRAVEYSAFLAAFYVPVLAVLNSQARGIALDGRSPTGDDDVVTELAEQGLNIPLLEMIKTFCAILAPFAVGLLGPISDALKAVAN